MTVKMAICDDECLDLQKLETHISTYAQNNNLIFELTKSQNQREILHTIQQADQYDILFLDIYMNALNGIELVKQLRSNGCKTKIVFVSTSKEHALDAYGVNAVQYLVKPLSYNQVENALDLLLPKEEAENSIILSAGSHMLKITLSELIYTETIGHYQQIILTNGVLEKVRISCTALYEMLGGKKEFVRLGASYIINIEYIKRITYHYVELEENHSIHIPRGRYKDIKKKYFDYYSELLAPSCEIKPGND
ncbi:MAG: response regulator transcription factor [Lachnospiraceae bacterium]|nr:response regulator transcription factor [Lachnospiraceae bacterium]